MLSKSGRINRVAILTRQNIARYNGVVVSGDLQRLHFLIATPTNTSNTFIYHIWIIYSRNQIVHAGGEKLFASVRREEYR